MMKRTRLIAQLTVFLLLSSAAVRFSVGQTKPQTTVQFVARGMEPSPKEAIQGDFSHAPSFGHVFMIISIPTLHGPKEEAYGFYAKKDTLSGVIKGPGMAKSEYRCGANDDCSRSDYTKFLKRFSESDDSVRIPVTEDQRKKIISEMDTWNHKEYRLTTESCMDFANTVVKDLGYPAVPRYPIQRPTEFLDKLRTIVAVEDLRKARAEAEARARAEAEARAKAEEAARQNGTKGCESGVFQEINPRFIWNLTFEGNDLNGQRTDGQCYFHLSRTGETWSGLGGCGQPFNVVIRANDGCTQLTSNLSGFCPVLNRK